MLFGSLVLRTGFGPDFAARQQVDDETYVAGLRHVAVCAWTSGTAGD